MPPRISRDEWLGYLALLAAIALFSTIEVAVKRLVGVIPPLRLATIRFVFTGLILLPFALRRIGMWVEPMGRRDVRVLTMLGLIGVTLSLSFYHVSLRHLPANVGAIVFSANPAFVAAMAPLMLGETLSKRSIAAVALGLAGIVVFAMVKTGAAASWVLGIVYMTVAQAAFALYSVLTRRHMPRFGAVVITSFAGLIGGAAMLGLSWVVEGSPFVALTPAVWLELAYITVVATAIPYLLFFYGIVQVGAARGSMFFFLKPVLASVCAYVVLRETLTPGMLAGAALIVAALGMALLPGRKLTMPE